MQVKTGMTDEQRKKAADASMLVSGVSDTVSDLMVSSAKEFRTGDPVRALLMLMQALVLVEGMADALRVATGEGGK